MHRSMCVLEKLYQWAINANRNNQEDSNDRHIFEAKAFALHSFPVSISNTHYYILKHCLHYIQECNQNFATGVSLSASKNNQENHAQEKNGYHFWRQMQARSQDLEKGGGAILKE